MRKLMILAAVTFATPVEAAPTYLVCSFQNVNLDVTADEANGEVTTLVSTSGHLEKRPAIFSATAVKWTGAGNMGISYVLSRTDLSLQRTLVIGDKSFPDTATCKIQQTPKRAF